MRLENIIKKETGKFINRYDLVYRTENNQEKIYEMISRNKDIKSLEDLRRDKPDAVVIIVTNEHGDKLLLNREYRMAVGDWVYNFPAGLIDAGETPLEAAKRELREETGLELYEIEDTIGVSYSAVGFSNEINVCIVGKARGEILPSDSEFEEIEAHWYTKAELKELVKTEKFAARSQAYCYMWSK